MEIKRQVRDFHMVKLQTLFRATMKGVFLFFNKLSDSIVCGSKPCMMSTTKIAMSQRDDPRDRKLLQYTRDRYL